MFEKSPYQLYVEVDLMMNFYIHNIYVTLF